MAKLLKASLLSALFLFGIAAMVVVFNRWMDFVTQTFGNYSHINQFLIAMSPFILFSFILGTIGAYQFLESGKEG